MLRPRKELVIAVLGQSHPLTAPQINFMTPNIPISTNSVCKVEDSGVGADTSLVITYSMSDAAAQQFYVLVRRSHGTKLQWTLSCFALWLQVAATLGTALLTIIEPQFGDAPLNFAMT